ncbi:MAG: glycine cleavage system aminomethyltransferase GcvT [Catalinimonas sp.]
MTEQLRRVPLHDTHVALGAKMVPFAGWEMPLRYSTDTKEHMAVRERVGVFDVSHMGEFYVSGPGAFELVQRVTSNDVGTLHDGKVQYATLTNDRGGVVDDLLVYRLAEERYLLVVNAANIEKDWNWIARQNTGGAAMHNVSEQMALLAVQGPKAAAVLQSLTEVDLAAMKYYTFQMAPLAGVPGVVISATGYTGAGGFELYVPAPQAKRVWDAVFEAGAAHGIEPVGLGARDTLRLEMGYCLYGNDLTDDTSPLEAGLGWITKLKQPFVGSALLAQQKAEGVQRKLVGFRMVDRGIPRRGYELQLDGERVGEVTSGAQSPCLGVGIGLGYVPTAVSAAGTELHVVVRGRKLRATIVPLPFYRPDAHA